MFEPPVVHVEISGPSWDPAEALCVRIRPLTQKAGLQLEPTIEVVPQARSAVVRCHHTSEAAQKLGPVWGLLDAEFGKGTTSMKNRFFITEYKRSVS
jgi:hypothetical protein